ncbi:hypothetical protein GCM10027072_62570 [Streptomyces bullii]
MAGCDSSKSADGASSPHRQTPQSPAGQTSTRQPSTHPSAATADGRDAGACADGTCEIAVSEPVTFRFQGPAGPATLSVTEVGPDKVAYTVKSGDSRSKIGTLGPGQECVTVLRGNGGGTSCGRSGDTGRPSPQPDAVVIRAATGEDGTAILHLVSG